MTRSDPDFYDALAEYYHLIFESWPEAIERQAVALGRLLSDEIGGGQLRSWTVPVGSGLRRWDLQVSGTWLLLRI